MSPFDFCPHNPVTTDDPFVGSDELLSAGTDGWVDGGEQRDVVLKNYVDIDAVHGCVL